MSQARKGPAASINAILHFLLETVYGPPEAATDRVQALATVLLAENAQRPLRLPGSGFSLWGFPDHLRVLPDGKAGWNLPAAEICADLRKVLDHLARWKRDNAVFGNGAAILASGVPVAVTVRMSLGNDGADPHRHFLALQGSPKDVFLAVILLLLVHGTTAKVRACPECSKVFFRTRRQTHCEKKCYDAWYWREKYTPQQKARARQTQYDKEGWKLGAKGSPLGQLDPSISVKSRRQSSPKSRGE